MRADVDQSEKLIEAINTPTTTQEYSLETILRMQRDVKDLGSWSLGDILQPVLPEALPGINTLLLILAAFTDSQLDQDLRRRARMAILKSTRGSWAGEVGEPKDGVFYQEKMRAAWS